MKIKKMNSQIYNVPLLWLIYIYMYFYEKILWIDNIDKTKQNTIENISKSFFNKIVIYFSTGKTQFGMTIDQFRVQK